MATAEKQKVQDHPRGRELDRRPGDRPAYAGILDLQHSAGNRATTRLLQSRMGGGQPLALGVRREMESRFDQDFSGVRVHTGPAAERSARSLSAKAYTLGSDVVFGAGRYAPEQYEGKRLLAHELSHVVQQTGATPTATPQVGGRDTPAEAEASAAASRVASGGSAGHLTPGATASIQREPEGAPAAATVPDETLGEFREAVVSATAGAVVGNGPARVLFTATLRGFVLEMRSQIAEKGQAAADRLQELKSVKNMAAMYGGYMVGLVRGVLSPLTGLFDLAVFGESMQHMAIQLGANVLKGGMALLDDVNALREGFSNFAASAAAKLKELKSKPLEMISSLVQAIGEAAKQKATAAGRSAAAAIVKALESRFEEKPSESWSDILTKRKEGESYSKPLGLANAMWERGKEKLITSPWGKIGDDIGYAVGALVINVVLLATTGGIGNAITKIGSALGKIAPVLGRVAKAVAAIGRAVAVVEEGIAVIFKGILKPLEPLLKELEPLLLRLRGFLRRLMGLAEDEAGAAVGALSKAATPEPKVPRPATPKPTPKPTTPKPVVPEPRVPKPKVMGEPGLPQTPAPPSPQPKPDVAPPAQPKPQPKLKGVPGTGKPTGPARGKLRLAASEGEIVPPPTEPQAATAAASELEEGALAATGTGGRGAPGGVSRPTGAPQGIAQQQPTVANIGGGNKPPPPPTVTTPAPKPALKAVGPPAKAPAGPPAPVAKPAPPVAKPVAPVEPKPAPAPTPGKGEKVWVNTKSKARVYHKSDSPFYGKTKSGQFMDEADAIANKFRAAKPGGNLEAARHGTAENARMVRELRPFEGMKMDNGWTLQKVERAVGGSKRVDQLWIHHGNKKIAVSDMFTGKVEPPSHFKKGMNYRLEKEIEGWLKKGYTYEYHPVIRPRGEP
jgi:hypothetical protein